MFSNPVRSRLVLRLLEFNTETAMGTVGISFGSPTSGTGFNVSTTVASIVANLKNVETPWNTQLTSLKAEDTAISSLGTLISNLSNDMSSLTDLKGVMAIKTGSSSNTGVLTLTSATSDAVAGTHTVTVTNLAATSSGYLAEISSASDTLSGSITLQIGNGTAQTVSVPSGTNTLAGLAKAINSSGAGITASVLTDSSGSRLSLVSGTSGANGNITVSANGIIDTATHLSYTGTAGTSTTTSVGTLTGITTVGDTLSGSISIQVGSGAAKTITIGTSSNTLATLAAAINTADTAVTASVVTNTDGTSSLQVLSNTAGTAGTLTVTSSVVDASVESSTSLAYTSPVAGKDANLTIDGVDLTSSTNTVTDLIPGVTFQLLAPSTTESDKSLQQVQVVIGNDNTGVESTFNTMVSDYNSLISAMNTQEGYDSSGNAEPLYGSPTLSLLQQQLLGGINATNPNGSLDSISNSTDTTLTGSISITEAGGTAATIIIGAGTNDASTNTYYTGTASGYNTLSGVADAINAASLGYTASVVTSSGKSSLTLESQTAGSSGALTATSSIVATSNTALSYSGTNGSSGVAATGTLTGITSADDTLTGSITLESGTGTSMEFDMSSLTTQTLTGLESAINDSGIGVTASITTSNGKSSLTLTSNTTGTSGDLTVSSSLLDTTDTSTKTLSYTNSSDITSLTSLGISVDNKGVMTFDAASMDSLLNSDFSSVAGFFQNANSWGQSFSTMLNNAGTSSTKGILSLASASNSNVESALNADISREELLISAQAKSLTTELNSANEIMQMIPTELNSVNELYSAITGYNQSK
jgi:flagellar hook-associated protein 2